MSIWEFLSGQRETGAVLAAGLLGGAVRWATMRSDWKSGLIGIFVGGVSAIYLSPLVKPLLGPLVGLITDDPSQSANFSGFVVGIGGITITGFLMDYIAARAKRVKSNDDSDSGTSRH